MGLVAGSQRAGNGKGGEVRLFKTVLMVVALSLAAGSICYAIYSKSVTSHVKIIVVSPGPPENVALEFYKDSACTLVCSLVEWSEVERGQTVIKTEMFWVKNIGSIAVTTSGSSTLPQAVGTLIIQFKKGPTWLDSISLDVGEVCETKGILAIDSNATLGDVNFSIVVSVG